VAQGSPGAAATSTPPTAHFIPIVMSRLRASLVVCVQNLNLGIRRGSNQLLEKLKKTCYQRLKITQIVFAVHYPLS
jgi:hypothetical protein